jgi:hypothetical protein
VYATPEASEDRKISAYAALAHSADCRQGFSTLQKSLDGSILRRETTEMD